MRPPGRSLPLALLCLSLLPWPVGAAAPFSGFLAVLETAPLDSAAARRPRPAAAEARPQAGAALFAPNGQVEVQRVIQQVQEGKAARARLEQDLENSQARMSRNQGELVELKADLEKQAPSLSPDAVRQRQQEIQRVFLEAQSSAKAMQEELEEKERQATAGISRRLLRVVDGVAKAAQCSLVFDAEAVFAGPIDLTAETIAVYDGGEAAPNRDAVRAPLGFAFIQQDKLPGGGTAAAGDAAREALSRRVRELAGGINPASGRALVLDKSAVLYAPAGSDATSAVARALASHAAVDGFVLPLLRGGFAYADVQRIVQEVGEGKAARVRPRAEPKAQGEALERDKDQQAMARISTRLLQVVAELAEGERLAVVLDKAALLYGPASTDLTNAVIRRYDEKFGGK